MCQETGMVPAAAPLHPWEWSSTPWSRLHVDFAGPFMGQMFMVLVDAHSKWMEVQVMSNITAQKTIKVLRGIFSIHGLPHTLVSDNGPAFISRESDTFLKNNSIRHIKVAPYHPSTNGLAERAVGTFKQA